MVTQDLLGKVTFAFCRPSAHQVNVTGEFNNWKLQPMKKNGRYWSISMHLKPGTYQFMYVADGEWFPDYAANGLVESPFGRNSIVVVQHRLINQLPYCE